MKTTPNIAPSVLAGASALLFALAAPAATYTLNPSADAFVTTGPSANLSGNNYGGAGVLSVAASGSTKGEFQSVLRFDFSGAKTSFDAQLGTGNWSVQSITLQLTAAFPNNAIFNASAAGQFGIPWMPNDSWTEATGTPSAPSTSGITYSTLSAFISAADESLGTFSFGGGTSGNNTYNLALTSGFDADATAGNLVSFRLSATDTTVSYLFDSRSFGTTSLRPLLTVTAVPEPGALSLLATGAVLFLGARCRRNRHG